MVPYWTLFIAALAGGVIAIIALVLIDSGDSDEHKTYEKCHT